MKLCSFTLKWKDLKNTIKSKVIPQVWGSHRCSTKASLCACVCTCLPLGNVFVGLIIVQFFISKCLMCEFTPPAKSLHDLGPGHRRLVFPLQPRPLPGGEGTAGWVTCQAASGPMLNYHKKHMLFRCSEQSNVGLFHQVSSLMFHPWTWIMCVCNVFI